MTARYLDELNRSGHSLVSRHESRTAEAEWVCTPAGLKYVVNLLTGSRELVVVEGLPSHSDRSRQPIPFTLTR